MTDKAMVEPLDTKAWVLVPVEPTEEMKDNAFYNGPRLALPFPGTWGVSREEAATIYRAMLSASPSLPVVDGGELVERLKAAINLGEKTGSRGKHPSNIYNLADEAADLISSQKQEIERLREALKPFARIADMEEKAAPAASVTVNVNRCRDARAALKENGNG